MQSAKEEMRNLERIRYVTENYEELQGLKNVPTGLVVLMVALFLLGAGAFPGDSILRDALYYLSVFLLVSAFVLYFVIRDYYERRFGWVWTFSTDRKQVVAGALGLAAVFAVGGMNILFEPPLRMLWLMWGAALVAVYWRHRRFRAHYVVIGALVMLLSFLPLLGVLSPGVVYHDVNWLLVFMGTLLTVGGILDHLLLVRTMKFLPEDADAIR